MIGVLYEKEIAQRRAFIWIAIAIVCIVAGAMPQWFSYSLQRAAQNPSNEMTFAVLYNFRSYGRFAEVQWAARSLPQLIVVLALLMGAGALAGEREDCTLPVTGRLGVRLRTLVLVKFGSLSAVLALAAACSTVVIVVHSRLAQLPLDVEALVFATAIGLLNALAFLAVVMLGSALASRSVFGGIYGLLIGVALVVLFWPLGVNAMELATNLFAADGRLLAANAARDVTLGMAILVVCLIGAVGFSERRGAV
jgi:ABC-type transport system involved in multi-copper enzyme maturation permease subunit